MFKPSSEQLIIKSFIESLPSGAYVSYFDIQSATSITMDHRGKSILRSSLKSLGIEYRVDVGKGIELESKDNCLAIVTGRVNRVSKALTNADKTTSKMVSRYIKDLDGYDRDRLISTASLFGAIHAMSKGLSKIYKPKVDRLAVINRHDVY